MPLVLSLDLGTTTITALCLTSSAARLSRGETAANAARIAADGSLPGRSEWDADRIAAEALAVLKRLTASLGNRTQELAGIGLTGQQHGVVLVDRTLKPQGPFINWQDRRTEELDPQSGRSWLALARNRAGQEARRTTGCTLAAGYMGATLFWLQSQGLRLRRADGVFSGRLHGRTVDGRIRRDRRHLGRQQRIVRRSIGRLARTADRSVGFADGALSPGARWGPTVMALTPHAAEATGLPAGLPVCVGVGDNQASVYGSVAELEASVLVNVGTGGQVAAFSDRFLYGDPLETAPFPAASCW